MGRIRHFLSAARWHFARGAHAIGAMLGRAVAALGFRDLMLFAGLAIAGYGLALIYWPAAFVIPGAILAAVAVFGVR